MSAFSTWEKELHKIVFDPRYLLLNLEERKQVRPGRGMVAGSGHHPCTAPPVPPGGCSPVESCRVVWSEGREGCRRGALACELVRGNGDWAEEGDPSLRLADHGGVTPQGRPSHSRMGLPVLGTLTTPQKSVLGRLTVVSDNKEGEDDPARGGAEGGMF